MADQAKGKGIAPKRASNPADPGNIKTLLLSLNTLKASVEDSVSTIKNISSTLASPTNSSNAAATGKTSYSPRFDPFSGTIDLDSPLRPPRKEPYLGPAIDNTATSNLDPPIDTGSKEGFKDTITSSIVKELSKKAYTIPDDKSKKGDVYNEFHALTFSTYRKGLLAFNAEFNGCLAKLTIAKIDIEPSLILNQYFKALESKFPSWVSRQKSFIRQARMLGLIASSLNIKYLIADILEESRNPATEAYRAVHVANSSNSTPNSNSNPSKKGKNKKKGSYNLAIEEEEESDSSSNSSQLRPIKTGNSPISPASIGSITLKVLSRKASPTYTKLVLDNLLYLPNIDINIVSRVRHYDSGGCLIKETLYRGDRRYIAVLDFKKSGFFLDVKGSSKPILYVNFAFPLGLTSYNTTKSIEPPIIEDAIVSEAIEPKKRYKLRNSPAKGTTLEGVGPSLRGKRPCRPTREAKPLTSTRDLPYMLREPVIEGNKVEKAISSPTLKEPNIGHIGLCLLKKTSSITKRLPNFDKIKDADFYCFSCDRGKVVRRVSKALIPDLPRVLNLIEGDTVKIRPRPYNRNPIVLLLVNRKSRYRWVFNLPNKSGPIVANAIKGFFRGLRNGFGRYPTKFYFDRVNSTAKTNKETTPFQALFDDLEPCILYIPNLERYRAIGVRGEAIIPLEKQSKSLKFTSRMEECKLLVVLGSKTYLVYVPSRRAVLKTSIDKFIEDNTVLSQPTNNTALEGELVDLDLDLEGAVSLDPSNLNTEKPISIEIGPSKLEPYESSSNSKLDEPLPDKPINPVIVESTRPSISIRKPELPEAFP
ncbi:hypothetical protein P8C59_005332 [Phyllachora maydis]|uniref:Integrase catalytic domain-containing protein n=1 Tax=Phyllachora maydis TaxID=1825666 RepID=A0AAD9I5C7_9PEZI|nr:hypothetical protein P8C59_005332 [Phyllachora maydis]